MIAAVTRSITHWIYHSLLLRYSIHMYAYYVSYIPVLCFKFHSIMKKNKMKFIIRVTLDCSKNRFLGKFTWYGYCFPFWNCVVICDCNLVKIIFSVSVLKNFPTMCFLNGESYKNQNFNRISPNQRISYLKLKREHAIHADVKCLLEISSRWFKTAYKELSRIVIRNSFEVILKYKKILEIPWSILKTATYINRCSYSILWGVYNYFTLNGNPKDINSSYK